MIPIFLDHRERLPWQILLMGADSNELKKVKYVVRCAVTMAYNLLHGSSFLLDQKQCSQVLLRPVHPLLKIL